MTTKNASFEIQAKTPSFKLQGEVQETVTVDLGSEKITLAKGSKIILLVVVTEFAKESKSK